MTACGVPESRLAHLALRKAKLKEEIDEINSIMKELTPQATLPITVEIDDKAVLIRKPYSYSKLPVVAITDICKAVTR